MLHDYKCSRGHVTEKLTRGEDTMPCPACGDTAHKVGVYPIRFTFAPTRERTGAKYTRFQEASAEIDHTCRKFESETNAKVPDLNLWQTARSDNGNRRRHTRNEEGLRGTEALRADRLP